VSRRDRFRQARTPAREAAERIEAIVEAAERAAETVIDDAERHAQGELAAARAEADRLAAERLASLSRLTDTLFAEAEAMGRQAESLLDALERAKAELAAAPGEQPAELPRQGRSHLTAVAEPPGPAEPQATDQGTPAGARLLATQMAISGNSREEIELRLRNGFEIEDTTSILDAILGPED